MIEQYVHWNEEIGEWQLRCVAYTGNNMRKQTPMPDRDKKVPHLFSPLPPALRSLPSLHHSVLYLPHSSTNHVMIHFYM